MKRILLALTFLFSLTVVMGQTLNADLEVWTVETNNFVIDTSVFGFPIMVNEVVNYNTPEDWTTVNQLTQSNVADNEQLVFQESGTVLSGSSSARLETREITLTVNTPIGPQSFTNNAPGLLVSGFFQLDENEVLGAALSNDFGFLNPFTYPGVGQPNTMAAQSMAFNYQYTGANGDSALVVSGLVRNDTIIAYGIQRLPDASSWTRVELDYTYVKSACTPPDTVVTMFCASNLDIVFQNGTLELTSNYTGENGSVLFVDSTGLLPFPGGGQPPVANDDSLQAFVGTSSDVEPGMNDIFCNDDNPVFSIISGAVNGTESLSGTTITYTPDMGFTGSDSIVYALCTDIACDTAVIYVEVSPVPTCDAVDDTYTPIPANTATLLPVLANDADCGNGVQIVTNPSFGVATVIASTGEVSYSPNTNYVGSDQFTYRICSSIDPTQCDTATVTMDIAIGINTLANNLYSLYPNPATQTFFLTFDESLQSVYVTLMDATGRIIEEKEGTAQTQFDVSSLEKGVYGLYITTDKGQAYRPVVVR